MHVLSKCSVIYSVVGVHISHAKSMNNDQAGTIGGEQ
jgi:hypothetical protein